MFTRMSPLKDLNEVMDSVFVSDAVYGECRMSE